MQGVGTAAYDLAVRFGCVGQCLAERSSVQGQHRAVNKATVEQRLQYDWYTANLVQIACQVTATGLQVGNQRRTCEHFGNIVQRKADARLVSNGRDVQG